jgi:hypothetical protein
VERYWPQATKKKQAFFLGFHVGDRTRVFDRRIGAITEVASTVAVGPQTHRRVDVQPMLRKAGFFGRFEPGGFGRAIGGYATGSVKRKESVSTCRGYLLTVVAFGSGSLSEEIHRSGFG